MAEVDPPLEMRWPSARLDRPPVFPPPTGYVTKSLIDRDEFFRIQAAIGWTMRPGQWEELINELLPGGMIFCKHVASDELVGVACAQRKPPESVELGWVAVIPTHQGTSLAFSLCATLMAHVLSSGHSHIF